MPPATAKPAPSAAETPIPPRFWWLKRILASVGLMVVGLVALWFWWNHEAERRLQAKIDEYRAAGQPVTLEDFQTASVPDEENAAVHYVAAAAAIKNPPRVSDLSGELSDPAVWKVFEPEILALFEANAEALRLVAAARDLSTADWDSTCSRLQYNQIIQTATEQRALTKLLVMAAHVHHHRGDDAAAVRTILDALQHSERLAEWHGSLLNYLVANGVDALAVRQIESIAPELAIEDGDDSGSSSATAAPRESIEQLLAALQREAFEREGYRQGLYAERVFLLDVITATGTANGPLAMTGAAIPPSANRLLAPLFTLDAVMQLDVYTRCAAIADAESYPAACRIAPEYPRYESGIARNAHFLSNASIPATGRVHNRPFETILLRRFAATATALRLYEIDHGERPPELGALVPDYLPAVPLDPFSDGDPIGYLPNAKYPRLYSVGDDGVDHGGDSRPVPAKEAVKIDMATFGLPSYLASHIPRDRVFFLTTTHPRKKSYLLEMRDADSQFPE